MTVALAEIDVALARLGYRGPNSRELVIENTGHYDPGGRSRQVTPINTSGSKESSCSRGAHSPSSLNSHKSVGAISTIIAGLLDRHTRVCLRPRNPSLSTTPKTEVPFSQEAEFCLQVDTTIPRLKLSSSATLKIPTLKRR